MTATPRDIIDDCTSPTGSAAQRHNAGRNPPATAADMQKFVTKNWVSTVSTAKLDFTQSETVQGERKQNFGPLLPQSGAKFHGNVPDTARTFGGGSTCRGGLVLVWSENGNVMRFIDGVPPLRSPAK